MYNQQKTAENIKNIAKSKNIPLKTLLENCELNINFVSDLIKGNDTKLTSIYKIADYLNVSLDYLTGRTDEPKQIQNINNNQNSSIEAIQTKSYSSDGEELNGIQKELIEAIKDLPKIRQSEILTEVYKMIERK